MNAISNGLDNGFQRYHAHRITTILSIRCLSDFFPMPLTPLLQHQAEVNDQPTVFSLLESLQDPAFIIKPDGQILAVNLIFASRIGKTPEECLDHTVTGLFAGDRCLSPLPGVFETQRASVLRCGKSSEFEDPDHAWKVTLNPVRSSNGEITSLFAILHEISQPAKRSVEESASAHQEELASVLEGSGAGIWEWTLKTGEIYWFGDVASIFGIEKKRLGQSFESFQESIHPDDRDKISRSIQEAARSGCAIDIGFRVVQPDGSVRWILMRGAPGYGKHGEPERYVGAVLDITAHKQSTLEPLENRKRLTLALEAARAGIWEWNSETGNYIWSDELWPLHGLTRDDRAEPSFNLWADSIHPDDRSMATWAVTAAARQQRELNIEYRTIHRDGSIHWLMSRGKPRTDEYGTIVGYIGTVIDITERKLAEIRLGESRFRFNFALEVTGAGIWEWDVKTDRLFWSDQVWKLYGLEPQGKISSHKLCGTNVHPEDRDMTFQTIMSASRRRVDFTVEYRVCHPDSSIRWLMCRGVPLQSSDTLPGSYLGMIMDITDRKRAEEERRKSQKQLNLVIEQGDIGVWSVDLRDSRAQRTLQYARIFGYDSVEGDWSLEAFLKHVVPEERETIREKVRQCCKTHLNHTFECRIRTADNRLRWIWVFGTFNYDTSTRTYYLSGIVQDITVRKQAELLLKESEQKFKDVPEFL
ncbi:MAG: PAS domain-containing protein, partial [Desulfobulbaceae bacterium]|nr:PAS domain-containing protein [Desulfobulbaceae bacterium]